MRVLLFVTSLAITLFLPACQSLKNTFLPKNGPRLSEMDDFNLVGGGTDVQKPMLLLLNSQVTHYKKVVGVVNDYLSDMDGRQRGFSLLALGGRGFMGATSVASAALTAAAPAANAPWIQGATATNAAYSSFEGEMNNQRLSGMAMRESMQLTANDIQQALAGLKFFEAFEAIVNNDTSAFHTALINNQKAFINIEQAVTLKPFTHVVEVRGTTESSTKPLKNG